MITACAHIPAQRLQPPGPQLRRCPALAAAASSAGGRCLVKRLVKPQQARHCVAGWLPATQLHQGKLLPRSRRRQQQQQQQQPVVSAAAAISSAAPTAAAAAQAFWPALVQAWNTNPAAVMMGAGACILGVALSIFLLASIPTMLAMRRTARAMETLLLTVQAEVPDTAATLRLSGMELADCIQEVGALSTDLTEGVRASARAVASAEAGLRQGADMATRAMTDHVLPQARDRLELALQERARLGYTREVLESTRQALQSTKSAAQRLRFAAATGGLASGLLRSARYLRRPGGSGPVVPAGGGSTDDLLGV